MEEVIKGNQYLYQNCSDKSVRLVTAIQVNIKTKRVEVVNSEDYNPHISGFFVSFSELKSPDAGL